MKKNYHFIFGLFLFPDLSIDENITESMSNVLQYVTLLHETNTPHVVSGFEMLNTEFYKPLYAYLLVVLVGVLLYLIRHQKKQHKVSFGISYLAGNPQAEKEEEQDLSSKNVTKLNEAISSDTEKHILNGLKRFENRKGFTNKAITLAYLAADLETNVRYLSEVVKKHKAENFKAYIHILRINFVLEKIETDSSFRKYKISHLAEISGFPTSALFTKVFKEITGYTPTAYLLMLSEKEQIPVMESET